MSEKYLKLRIDNEELDIDTNSDFPIEFDYQIEDSQDFQKKKSSESIGLKLPATLRNQRILNTFHNTSVEDNSPNQSFKNIRNIVAEANGVEIFVGKALPKRATKRGGIPVSYELNCFGNNADWLITLKETTLYDLLRNISLNFNRTTIVDSWRFDGLDESLPYVFAPVKYGSPMDPDELNDNNYSIKSMRPSLSVYWILRWGFQSAGYNIKSDFFDTSYFRRLVTPWTFGAFLSSEGTKFEIHTFLAKSSSDCRFEGDYNDWVDLLVLDTPMPPCFDNNNTIEGGDYSYHAPEMRWKYNTPHYGELQACFSIALSYDYKVEDGSDIGIEIRWYKNNVVKQKDRILNTSDESGADLINRWFTTSVNPDDVISCKVYLYIDQDKNNDDAYCTLSVDQFKIDYFKIPTGGNINFDSYLALQKNKFLDFVKGVADLFNLSFQTDPVNNVVLIEPTHDYPIANDISNNNQGYYSKQVIDWSKKVDLSEDSIVEIYDDNAREFVFKFKDDSNDGALKIVQDRYKIVLGSGKYIFSERFKAEKKEFENRYFTPTMHYLVDEFKDITGQAPQMVCLVPENISNTSSSESQNTFLPKICYYKGVVNDAGGWVFDGITWRNYPYMFAVNYKSGGENDPILSYTDEKIGNDDDFVIGRGLIKRFFWQRLAIMNNGQWLHANILLNNNDIINWFHRERISIDGELFELINIKGYNSLKYKSTQCILRKWVPISKNELNNTYPSELSIRTNAVIVTSSQTTSSSSGNEMDKVFDTQYNRLMCLYKDIPR